ncbi:MAG: hypothetical protein WBM02_00795 [bacterium]
MKIKDLSSYLKMPKLLFNKRARKGKRDGSHIVYRLGLKHVQKACKKNRFIGFAHGVVGKWQECEYSFFGGTLL